jgi:putative phosphoribosyl transferase
VPVAGRTAIIVDDGVATGATAMAACQVARAQGAARIILAVPVAARDAISRLAGVADEVVCVHTPQWLSAIGAWYADFRQVSDEQVVDLLRQAAAPRESTTADQGRRS